MKIRDYVFNATQGEHPDAARLEYRSDPDAPRWAECESCGEMLAHNEEGECESCVLFGQAEYNREHDARAER